MAHSLPPLNSFVELRDVFGRARWNQFMNESVLYWLESIIGSFWSSIFTRDWFQIGFYCSSNRSFESLSGDFLFSIGRQVAMKRCRASTTPTVIMVLKNHFFVGSIKYPCVGFVIRLLDKLVSFFNFFVYRGKILV